MTNQINLNGIGEDNEALRKLRDENAQLSEELIRKSQSLVDALRALAEFHENPQDITRSITSNLSHANEYMYHHRHHDKDSNGYERKDEQKTDPRSRSRSHSQPQPSSYADISEKLQVTMAQEMRNPKPKLEIHQCLPFLPSLSHHHYPHRLHHPVPLTMPQKIIILHLCPR